MFLILYRIPLWIVFSAAIAALILYSYISKRFLNAPQWHIIKFFLLAASLYLILQCTILERSEAYRELHLQPLRQIIMYRENSEILRSILLNVALFFPFGLLLSDILVAKHRKSIAIILSSLCALSLSLIIETIQYIFYLGEADIDDVIFNVIGAFLGAGILKVKDWIEKFQSSRYYDKTLIKYLFITFGFSWFSWAFLSYFSYHGPFYTRHPVSIILHIIGFLGPALGAICVVGTKEMQQSMRYLKTFFSLKTIAFLLSLMFIEFFVFDICFTSKYNGINIFAVILKFTLYVIICGISGELGWRKLLQKHFENKSFGYLSPLYTGLIWALWQIPLWFVHHSFQSNVNFILYTAFMIFLSYSLGALYRFTNSLLCCAVLHGFTNTILSFYNLKMNLQIIILTLLIIIASIILYKKTER